MKTTITMENGVSRVTLTPDTDNDLEKALVAALPKGMNVDLQCYGNADGIVIDIMKKGVRAIPREASNGS